MWASEFLEVHSHYFHLHCTNRIDDMAAKTDIVAGSEEPYKHQSDFSINKTYIEVFITPRASFTVIVAAVILWVSHPSDTILRCGQWLL